MDKKGFIYVMTNDSMPDLVKVGMSKKVPTERAKELEDTGVPKPYVAQYYAFFDDMFQAEKKAHKALSEYHYNKEFYKIDVATAIYYIENIGLSFTKLYSKPEDDRIADELRLKMQQEQEEKKRVDDKLKLKIQQEQEEKERVERELREKKCREEEREREYWRHIVTADQKELRGEKLTHKLFLEKDELGFTFIEKGESVLFPEKTLVRLDDLKKSDKFIKQFLEERERESENAYLEHQKLLTEKEKGLKSFFKLLIYLPGIAFILVFIYLIIFHWDKVK
ncbi:MAG: GIY-YIG nuclease family protein [Candidatus Scalindua sp.]